ncbi:hypothetical protein LMG27174_05028 [Paraburkholderia rhynchosiae]|uniref:Uncharacterized protein n=1 Tax=Paraburkholderia rhynchosiae TaxID=487049 RepID=A0A6J5BZB2_9BURK|nr:hypothetical protein LMG27174_05028 [Paraburkholderia rhynchosiae]
MACRRFSHGQLATRGKVKVYSPPWQSASRAAITLVERDVRNLAGNMLVRRTNQGKQRNHGQRSE